MKKPPRKLLIIAGVLMMLGTTSLLLENYHYQYLDEKGFLHESLFLPLGVFSLILGAALGLLSYFRWEK